METVFGGHVRLLPQKGSTELMPDQTESEQFEQFARRDLSFQYSRRELFELVPTALKVSQDEEQGIPGFTLASLGKAPDDYLAQVIPVIVPDCRISVADGWVWAQMPNDKRPKKLFLAETAVICAFNQFNGRTDLGEASHHLAQEMDGVKPRAFALVRGLFLHLIQHRVCLPR
jgi:hypothetical protein